MPTERIKSLSLDIFGPSWQDRLWLIAFVVLPFASYVSLALLIGLSMAEWVQRGRPLFGWLGKKGYGWLSAGLLVSTAVAAQPANALLQTMNFLPYFLMLGALVARYRRQPQAQRAVQFLKLAQVLVMVSVPFSALALLEYVIKFPAIAQKVSSWFIFQWAFDVSYTGHHASGTFGYHNILSAYLVVIISLGLGLLTMLWHQRHQFLASFSGVAGATVLAGIGVFCSGSRNGLLITFCLLIVVGLCLQRSRWVRWISGGFAIALGLAVLGLGIGGRHLSLALITQDPRVYVWQIALGMIQQRPLLGWGLGSFGHLYVPGSVPTYEHIHHAHNLWLYLASETGIPVMLGFCGVIGHLLYGAIKKLLDKSLPLQHTATLFSYLLAFGSCMLFGLFDVPIFDARINVFGWLLLAGLYLLIETSEPLLVQPVAS